MRLSGPRNSPVELNAPAEPVDGVEIRVREDVLSSDRRARRMGDVPRAERTRGFDLAFRHRIGQRRDIRDRLVDAERVHHEVMDGEDLRLFAGRLRNQA